MKSKQRKQKRVSRPVLYGPIYERTSFAIKLSSGMTEEALRAAASELSALPGDYADHFWSRRFDAFASIEGNPCLLPNQPAPLGNSVTIPLPGLTDAQYYFTLAWQQNTLAKQYLDGKTSAGEMSHAIKLGVLAAVRTMESLALAKDLLAAGDKTISNEITPAPSRLDMAAKIACPGQRTTKPLMI